MLRYSFHADAHEALLLVAQGLAPVIDRFDIEVPERDLRDVHAMLRHLLNAHKRSFGQVTSDGISPAAKSLAHEVRGLRNELFHGAKFDLETEFRLLSSCWRLLEQVDAPQSAQVRNLVDQWLTERSSSVVSSTAAAMPPAGSAFGSTGHSPADATSSDPNDSASVLNERLGASDESDPLSVDDSALSPSDDEDPEWAEYADQNEDDHDDEDDHGDGDGGGDSDDSDDSDDSEGEGHADWDDPEWAEEDDEDDAPSEAIQEVFDGVPLPVKVIVERLYESRVHTWGQMNLALWIYQGESSVECPRCGTLLDVCRKGAYHGLPDERSWAVVCVPCGTARRKQEYPPEIRSKLWRWGLTQQGLLQQ